MLRAFSFEAILITFIDMPKSDVNHTRINKLNLNVMCIDKIYAIARTYKLHPN